MSTNLDFSSLDFADPVALPCHPASQQSASVTGRDVKVPLVHGGSCTYANFDYAASAPALAEVSEHVTELLPYYASVHRGAGYASRISTNCYEGARVSVAQFVGSSDDQVVVFTRNTTDSLNLLAACVPGETVVLDIEHHANFLPWTQRGRRVVATASTIEETIKRVDDELKRSPAALLAITGASNVTGEILPLRRLADIAHQHGARIVVDGAQLAPHRRINLSANGIDYLAFSGHKLYAPFGAGVLVGRRDWLDAGDPYLAGGGAVREVSADSVQWAPSPQRHEGGSPNVLGVAAIAKASEVLGLLHDDAAIERERYLVQRLRDGLTSIPGVQLLQIWSDSSDAVGIVAFTINSYEPGRVAAYLSAEHGIGVRDGRFCAHPLLARLGVDAAIRASIGLGTSVDDVDRLIAALHDLVDSGERWLYRCEGGQWSPVPETRERLHAAHPAGSALCRQPVDA